MKTRHFQFLLIILLSGIFSCNSSGQHSDQNANKNSSDQTVSKASNYDDLIGGYALENNGKVQINILKDQGNYYFQFPGDNTKYLMKKVSDDDCSRILGSNWQTNLITCLHSEAYFVFKVKKGCIIDGTTINSGFYGALPAAGQIWKVK